MKNLNIIKELHITSDGCYGTYVTCVIYNHKTKHYYTEEEDIEKILNELEILLEKEEI